MCECIAVEPPVVLLRFHYWCDSHFDTTLLRDAVEAAERDDCVVQYVVVGGDGFTLANVREQDGHITVLSRPHDPNLPRKQNKGGQSAPRFGRLRENALHAYAKHVAESIEKQWPAYTADAKTSKKNEQKMVVAGSGMLKDAVVAELSPLIQKRIAATFDTQYNGLAGLQHAVDATLAQVSGNAQLKADLNKLQQLFDTLQRKEDANDDTVRVAIGRAEVDRALAINAAQRVLQHVQVEDWACLDETVTITRVSAQSGAAQMFLSGFGGIVAYLRFSVPRSLLLVPNEGGEEEDGDDETEWI